MGRDLETAVTLSGERLLVSTEWAEADRIRLRRHVTRETRLVEVTVHREELIVETDAALGADGALSATTGTDGVVVAEPHAGHEPLIIVLSEEVPQVTMHRRAYERIVVHVDVVANEETVAAALRREAAELSVTPGAEALATPAPAPGQ